MESRIGGTPTASETIMPILVPRSRLLQPLTGLLDDEEPESVSAVVSVPPSPPVGDVVVEAGVDAPSVAIGPTLMVVVDVG